MTKQTDNSSTTLSQSDTINFRHLLKILNIRTVSLDKKEIRALVPNQQKINWDNVSTGAFAFNPKEVWIDIPTGRHSIDLEKHYKPPQFSGPYEDQINHHYQYLFDILTATFTIDWFIEKIVEAMTLQYDALSKGQAEAVIKKFIPSVREDGETMSSTTRTQIHRLKAKINKYRQLVEAFDILMNYETSLEEIAKVVQPSISHVSAPYFIEDFGVVGGDSITPTMKDAVQKAVQPRNLNTIPDQPMDDNTSEEIEMTRQKLKEKGYDPDGELEEQETPPLDKIEDQESLYFLCSLAFCYHKEEFERDDKCEIIQKYHHNQPMVVGLPRPHSDY